MSNMSVRLSGSNQPIELTNDHWIGNIYYLTGVVLPINSHFIIKVPNGGKYSTATFEFVVDGNRNTTVTSNQ